MWLFLFISGMPFCDTNHIQPRSVCWSVFIFKHLIPSSAPSPHIYLNSLQNIHDYPLGNVISFFLFFFAHHGGPIMSMVMVLVILYRHILGRSEVDYHEPKVIVDIRNVSSLPILTPPVIAVLRIDSHCKKHLKVAPSKRLVIRPKITIPTQSNHKILMERFLVLLPSKAS